MLSAARATLYRGSPLAGQMQRFYIAQADSAGRIDVAERHSWHMIFIAIPDAEAGWSWAWCIEAPGYRPEWRMSETARDSTVLPLLRRSSVEGCPTRVANGQHLAALRTHRDTLAPVSR